MCTRYCVCACVHIYQYLKCFIISLSLSTYLSLSLSTYLFLPFTLSLTLTLPSSLLHFLHPLFLFIPFTHSFSKQEDFQNLSLTFPRPPSPRLLNPWKVSRDLGSRGNWVCKLVSFVSQLSRSSAHLSNSLFYGQRRPC